MTMLCRTAESLYWMGRYLERAESLTRLVREHTALVTDLPSSAGLRWASLLAVPGETAPFFSRFEAADETSVIAYLLADRANPSSVVSSLRAARENLRTSRATLPRHSWRILNELVLFADSSVSTGSQRGRRHEFCEHVIGGCQRMTGFLVGSMGRDPAWDFYQLGVLVERADMTSRLLDVRAAALVSPDAGAPERYADSQLVSLLRSLDGLQLYRRVTRAAISGDGVVHFALTEGQFPRSVQACLHAISTLLGGLPDLAGSEQARSYTDAARTAVADLPAHGWTPQLLHDEADLIQRDLASIDRIVGSAYFRLEGPVVELGTRARTGTLAGAGAGIAPAGETSHGPAAS